MALERITSAIFMNKSTVVFTMSSDIKHGVKVALKSGGITVSEAEATVGSDRSAIAEFGMFEFDYAANYSLSVAGCHNDADISKLALLDDADFIQSFECKDTQELEFGAIIVDDKSKTVFRLWAPLSSSVRLNLYKDGDGGAATARCMMDKRIVNGKWGGVWEKELVGNLHGAYYTYTVNNTGRSVETIDPYAKACSANGVRGMVIDFAAVDPIGWENDRHLYATNAVNADTPVLWEVQVKDFSSSPDSGMIYKGKYLAFTEENTTVPGRPELKTGVNYLKDLGITYVHLNPVYDFATIDESYLVGADNTKDNFNWGYDPQNYNIPEGSYSTDPARGEVRVNEFKQMVMALHKAGIGVVMDVVYNHTYQTQGQALHETVPYYYHRTNANGTFANGPGCGNETASERTMFRKYMVESVLFWATEYHIDGFRFDLMGNHDKLTLEAIRAALDGLDGGNGKHILMYGEPWAGFDYHVPHSYMRRVAATSEHIEGTGKYTDNADNESMYVLYAMGRVNALPASIAVFNDSARDGLRGNLWDGNPGKGWANGDIVSGYRVLRLLEGGAGGTGDGMHTGAGSRCIAYAAAHDNYTLWDQLVGKKHGTESPLAYDEVNETRIAQCRLVSAAYLMSSGVPFILAGEEMARTKYGNENSYKSPYKLNMLEWSRQEAFGELYEHYKTLIRARKKYSKTLFSYERSQTAKNCWGSYANVDGATGRIDFTRDALTLMLDPSTGECSVKIGKDKIV